MNKFLDAFKYSEMVEEWFNNDQVLKQTHILR